MTTPDNRELTSEEETPPALRAPIAAAIGGLILTIGLFLVLGSGTGRKHHTAQKATIHSIAPRDQPVISPSAQPPATPVSVSIRWHGTVTVSGPDSHRDLDAIPPRTDARESDLNGDWLETTIDADAPGVQIATLPQSAALPGYKQCHDAVYSNGTDHTEQLETGDVLCVVTSARRIARLKVTRAEQTSLDPIVKFSVTIWDPPAF